MSAAKEAAAAAAAAAAKITDEDDDGSWSDWEEDEDASLPTKHVFADGEAKGAAAAVEQAKADGLDLRKLAKALGLDFYGGIRLVNYVRSQAAAGKSGAEVTVALKAMVAGGPEARSVLTSGEAMLKSVVEGDPLLMYVGDIVEDEDEEENEGDEQEAKGGDAVSGGGDAAVLALRDENARLRAQLAHAAQLLRGFATEDDKTKTASGGSGGKGGSGEGDEDEEVYEQDNDSYYFNSYAHFGIHEEMLKDRARTLAYKEALERMGACDPKSSSRSIQGKVVIDIGCGSSILSMFAAKAGAAHVIAIDNSDVSLGFCFVLFCFV